MNRKVLLITLFLVVTSLLTGGCGGTTATPTAANIPPVAPPGNNVSAEAVVVPLTNAALAFESGGRVVEIPVSEGDQVTADQILARVSDADALAALAIAQAALAQAEANLAQTKTGATPEQIAVAQAAVTRAQTNLSQVLAGPTAEQIATAQARINILQAQLNQARTGSRQETIAASLATVKQAENAVTLAQTQYDKIAYAADSDQAQPIVLALQDATLRYEAALASHQALIKGATPQEIAVAQAQLAEGQAGLNELLAGASAEQIALAQVGVLEAEAALNQVKAGATTEQIAVAQSGVEQAKAALAQAQLALNKVSIKAPFTGAITKLDLKVGETVSPGTPVINIADISGWQIETDDLTEIDVVKVAPGQKVKVELDALPGESFAGVVNRIKPQSELKAGDVTYTVIITLTGDPDPRLRWGMTAFVEIETE